jgi:transcriptional regulator with XRE-family HTH domain
LYHNEIRIAASVPEVKKTFLGEKLKTLRGETSLYFVGEKSGIDRGTIQRYEKGTQVPTNNSLQKLADFYQVDFYELKKLWVADLFPPNSIERKALKIWLSENSLE